MLISLVKKIGLVYVEVINDCLFSSKDNTYKIIPINVAINGHNMWIIFNVIRSSLNLIILATNHLKFF